MFEIIHVDFICLYTIESRNSWQLKVTLKIKECNQNTESAIKYLKLGVNSFLYAGASPSNALQKRLVLAVLEKCTRVGTNWTTLCYTEISRLISPIWGTFSIPNCHEHTEQVIVLSGEGDPTSIFSCSHYFE